MEIPHIGLSHEKNISNEIFGDFLSILDDEELNVMVEAREPLGPMATYEWLIPTAVIVYIGKSYFDAFLKEMGKDHYLLLKKALASLRKRLVGEEAPNVTIISTAGKTSGSNKYSMVFSIIADTGNGFNFKLLIQPNVSSEEYDKITSNFIGFMDKYHSGTLDKNTLKTLSNIGVAGRTILCAYDFDKSQLEFLEQRPRRVHEKA